MNTTTISRAVRTPIMTSLPTFFNPRFMQGICPTYTMRLEPVCCGYLHDSDPKSRRARNHPGQEVAVACAGSSLIAITAVICRPASRPMKLTTE